MAKAKPVVKAAALDKTINASVDSLSKACSSATKALAKKTAEAKKQRAEVKRHLKKKATLTKRNKTAAAKQKRDANAVNRKAAATVAKELKSTKVVLGKARASKAALLSELGELKVASKRLTAYTKAIAAADKALNKPAKKRKKRKSTK